MVTAVAECFRPGWGGPELDGVVATPVHVDLVHGHGQCHHVKAGGNPAVVRRLRVFAVDFRQEFDFGEFLIDGQVFCEGYAMREQKYSQYYQHYDAPYAEYGATNG